jgi:hypothetical protein
MRHTKEQVHNIALKIIEDRNIHYAFKDEIEVSFERNAQPLWSDDVENCWIIVIPTPDFQFNDPRDAIIVRMDDDTGEIVSYMEGPGRPIPRKLKLNAEGKYEYVFLTQYM